jgi:hypothetical protein
MAQENKEYQDFLEKFKPKKTTDDCYTPPETFEEITRWVSKTYGIDPATIVRPFWPGGDYKRANYPAGCVVLDNPPFSILSQIVGFYQARGVRFFLFAPYLTCLNILSRHDVTSIVCDTEIVYENGARVNTSFVTNLDGRYMAMSAPSLARAIEAAEKRRLAETKKTLPKYKYPDEVLTATMLGYMAKYGVEYSVPKGSGIFIRGLESQKPFGKSIYGGGLLLAEKAAAEKAAAEKAAAIPWRISQRERMLIRTMGGT